MKKLHLSRRDFLKMSWSSLWGLFLVACKIETEEISTTTPIPTATDTPIPEVEKDTAPVEEDSPTNTPTETPTETPIPCFKLLTPEDGTELENIGKVIFSWEAMQGAEKYILEFTLPTGQPVEFETTETSITRYIELFTLGGEFFWKVTALDQDENIICVSFPFSFTKPVLPPPTHKKDDDSGSTTGATSATNSINIISNQ